MHRFLVAAAIAALSAPLAAAPVVAAPATVTTQLPRSVVPVHYDVSITPDAANLRFAGNVVVTINVLEPVTSITLNAADLTFRKASLSGVAEAPKITTDAEAQTATFSFSAPIKPGTYKLSMAYDGKIGTQATGLFALDYGSATGKKRALYTQFENSDARSFIPSWDEPSFKATFTLDATVPADLMTVGNMPIASKTPVGNGLVNVRFPQTPKMSTYLLFFGLGDFDRIAAKVGATEVGVVTQKGKSDQGQFALQAASEILKEYNDYFGTPFPLPKLDNVAAPGRSQFFGAMENWGSIFTFESAILLDPKVVTQGDKERSFSVSAHEMAHQWFGDLVTMGWWDDLWLNEGFASWMEGRTMAKLHPEWNTAIDAIGGREGAMSLDALKTTHPVVQHVETVGQASQAFDAITYQKGEAVIRMLEDYVGADAWRAGVRTYMKKHAYGNTVTDDLWREMDAASPGKPVSEIAHRFTLQPGVPLIRVGDAVCADGSTVVALTQGEFSKDQPGKTPLAWPVPVIARTAGNATARTVVSGGAGKLTVPGCGPVIVNAGQTGYYRTLYMPAAMKRVTAAFAALPAIDQVGILADAWSLGLAGYQPAADVMDLAAVAPASADPQVWQRIAGTFRAIDRYFDGDARQPAFRRFAIARLSPVFAAIGWEARAGEAAPVANLRNTLIVILGEIGDPAVIAEARRRYAADDMPAPIRRAVLSVVSTNADAATWDKLHAEAAAEKSPLVKQQLYDLLGSPRDKALAVKAMDLALTDEPGATTSAGIIDSVAGHHPDLAFDYALAHLEAVNKFVDATSRSRYLPGLASGSSDPAMIGKINAYAEKYLTPDTRRDAEIAAASIAYRVKIKQDRMPAIAAWLDSHGG
jgi:aminopeptidase N